VLVGQPELEQKLKQPQLRQLRQRLTLRAKTHALTLEETKAYVQQRLRIAGSNGQQIFEPEALVSIHRYAAGIPRVINLLCEHCLVSAFVDQQKIVAPTVVDGVARDFDLGDNTTSGALTLPAVASNAGAEPGKFDLVEALRSLATLADRLKQEEKDLTDERKL
jgi:2-hydroxychromene-2-carboxylate isomerase